MSTFAKKMIVVDENLSRILGVQKGALTSYAEITKGIYDYVKERNLRKGEQPSERAEKEKQKFCFTCGMKLPARAKFCDRCGREQSQPV